MSSKTPIISTVDPKEATGEVAELYRGIQQQFGMVPNGLRLFSASPHHLRTKIGELGYYWAHPTITQPLGAAIRLLIAVDHGCEYCVQVNSGMLARSGMSQEAIAQLQREPGTAALPKKEVALLLLVLKAVRTPRQVSAGDVAEVRALGWSDGDIFDAVAHGATAVATDILFDAFKASPEAPPAG